jgi:hypothetical protein
LANFSHILPNSFNGELSAKKYFGLNFIFLKLASAFEIAIPVLYSADPPNLGNEARPDTAGTFRLLKRVVSGAAPLDIINWTGHFSQSWISTQSLSLRSIEHAMAISEQIPIKGGVENPKTEIAL